MSKKNSGWGRKRTVVCFVTLAFLFLALGILMCEAGIAVKQAEELSQAVFRLHIVANSDSTVDQELKLKVRDAIAVEMEKLLETQENPTKEETMDLVTENIETFQNIGQSIVEEAGFDYQVTAMVCNQAFPTKEYLSLTLPAWDYDCLRVDIGAGEGQNWWCVLFPQLCFKEGIVGKLGPEEEGYIEDTLSTDTVEMITVTAKEKPVRVQVRFKIVEIIQSIKEAFRED
ncbi:MAG: stage II sporulation protein R [Clostridia bacterium]|nr:stage II sporulation protein R [Clostridia bacterium]